MNAARLVEVRDLKRVFDVSSLAFARHRSRAEALSEGGRRRRICRRSRETLGIVGKSARQVNLARMVVGLLRPSAGQVLIDGVDLFRGRRSSTRRDVRRRCR